MWRESVREVERVSKKEMEGGIDRENDSEEDEKAEKEGRRRAGHWERGTEREKRGQREVERP